MISLSTRDRSLRLCCICNPAITRHGLRHVKRNQGDTTHPAASRRQMTLHILLLDRRQMLGTKLTMNRGAKTIPLRQQCEENALAALAGKILLHSS